MNDRMNEWKQHLPDQTIVDIQRGLIQAGLIKDQTLDLMLGNVSHQYAGSLPGAGLAPNPKLLGQLQAMNRVHNLRNGDVPLSQWLTTAVAIAGDHPVADVLDNILLNLSENVAPRPGPAAGVAASVAASAAAPAGGGGHGLMNTDLEFEAMVAGSDDTLSVRYLSGGVQAARSVFKLLVHRHFEGEPEFTTGDTPRLVNGTGWMIGPGLMVTNHHVVNARMRGFVVEADATEADFKLQSENIQILYDYHQVDNPSHIIITGAAALVAANKDLDFAILRLPDGSPERPPLKLRMKLLRKTLAQALGTRVNVLQHPNGNPMRIGFRDNFVTIGDTDLLGYLTDTSSGSSGSPVCDDGWNVAALHAGSQSVSDQNIVIRGRKIKRENFGTPVPTLLATLKDNHPNLHEEILAGQQ